MTTFIKRLMEEPEGQIHDEVVNDRIPFLTKEDPAGSKYWILVLTVIIAAISIFWTYVSYRLGATLGVAAGFTLLCFALWRFWPHAQ